MWRYFRFLCMTDEEKSGSCVILCTQYSLYCVQFHTFCYFRCFGANKFSRDLRAFAWRKMEPKIMFVEKKLHYQVWAEWTFGWWELGSTSEEEDWHRPLLYIKHFHFSSHRWGWKSKGFWNAYCNAYLHPSELSKLKATDANCHLWFRALIALHNSR